MSMRKRLVIAGTILLVVAAGLFVKHVSWNEPAVVNPPIASPKPDALTANEPVPAGTHQAEPSEVRDFRQLSVIERSSILSKIRSQPLTEIFQLWQRAGVIDKDLMKQGAIATVMAYALREHPPSRELLAEMWDYAVNPGNSLRERGAVLGIFGGAKTLPSIEFLLKIAEIAPDVNLRRIAIEQIAGVGSFIGDGSYHEERSLPLESTWRNSTDGSLLSRTALAMAGIGAPSAINLLLQSALEGSPMASDRKQSAVFALEKVYTRNAVPAVAELLNQQTGINEASALAGRILVNIGDESAAKVLSDWLPLANAGGSDYIISWVAGTRTSPMLDAWKRLAESDSPFKSEGLHTAIQQAMKRREMGTTIEK